MELQDIIALLTLVILEAILGIDNVIFVSIISSKLPAEQQKRARNIGLILAGVMRLLLLLSISYIMKLDKETHKIFTGTSIEFEFTIKQLILLAGGIFLIYKSSKEIFHKSEGDSEEGPKENAKNMFSAVILQIIVIDLVFSVDSIITAVGMVENITIMYIAVFLTVIMMIFASGPIAAFINKHPSFKMLALAFLVMIGVSLIAEGLGHHIPKGYVYCSMAFSMSVNLLQMRIYQNKHPEKK